MGRIQSLHSFSTVDGPGTRVVIFLQGCPVGCTFCHNPDSWDMQGGKELSVEVLLRQVERFRPFLKSPGLTLSGGEPLAQPEFTLELITAAQAEGWHVALDTSGWGREADFKNAASRADLVMFSVKHPLHPEQFCRSSREAVWRNWMILAELAKPVWLRYVLIPGRTDAPEALEALKEWIVRQPRLEKIQILPYNSLAEANWRALGWDNPLFHAESLKVTEAQIRRVEARLGI